MCYLKQKIFISGLQMTQIKVKCNSLQIFPEFNRVTFTPTEYEISDALIKFGLNMELPAKPIVLQLDKGNLSFVPGEEYYVKFEPVSND